MKLLIPCTGLIPYYAKIQKIARVFYMALSFLFVGYQGIAQGTWMSVVSSAPHTSGGVMLLLSDGTVLAKTDAGGGNGFLWDRLTPDIHGSYINGTWSTVASMLDDRLYFSSQVLRDGRVYVCGGEYGSGGTKGEVFDPLANTWTAAPVTGYFVSDANSEILPDGRVLQAAVGSGTRHNKIWDPATNTYSAGPDCLRTDNEGAWLKLPDNTIVFIDNYSTSSERYMPATNTWINDGTVPVNVYDPYGDEAGAAFMLPDGRGFFIGSSGHNALYTPSGTAAPGTWAAAADIPGPSGTPDAASAMMTNGNILLAASPLPTSADHFPSPTSFFEYDYTTNTFTSVGAPGGGASLPVSAYITNMLDLPDGTVLFVLQGSNQYYEYTPGSAPLAAGKPNVNNIYRIACDTFMATGTLFNGISEGAGYGDDWQMASNYPIIRLSSGTTVKYCRTKNWNSTGLMRGSAPDTTYFALPAGLPVGSYNLEVVANGNPSSFYPINTSMAISPATATFCQNTTITMTDVWSGGSWSSANAGIASVNPVTGVVTGVSGGVTTISYFIGTCFATATVTINPAPTPITPLGGVNLCLGATVTLGSTPAGGLWISTAPFIASVGSTSGIVTGNNSGVTTITYTAVGCPAYETVTVNLPPSATITPSGSTAICPSSSVALNANAGAGYTYQWLSGGSAIAGATNITYTASAAGNYSVIVTNPQSCHATSAVTVVTISSTPPALITPAGPTTFCAGNNVILNANAGAGFTYQWLLGGTAIAGATNIAYTATLAGNYAVVVTNAAGCSTTSGITVITVNAVPAAITGVLTLCAGSTTSLNDATPAGTWSSSNIAVATVSGAGLVTGIGTGGIATISYTLGTGCSATAQVTVNAATAAAIAGPAAACIGQTITLTDGTPSGTWSSSAPGTATVDAAGVVTGIAAGVVTITYQVLSGCGTATVTRSVTVNVVPAVAPITGTLTVCSGATSALSDATPSGVWSISNPAIATISPTGVVTAIVPGLDTVSYSVTNIAGCTTAATAVFNVFSVLTAAITPAGPTTFCTGGFVLLNGPAGTGITYQWKKNGIIISGATGSAYSANSSGNYTVVVTLSGGCNATTSPVTVSVNPLPITPPAVAISATVGPVYCITTSPSTFTAIPTNGGSTPAYQWLVNGAAAGAGSVFGYTPVAGDILKCIMTSNAACAFPLTASASDTMIISPLRTPSVSIVSSPAVMCAGSPVTFTGIPVYGGTLPLYRWTRNDTNIATGPSYIYIPHNGDRLKVTLFSNYPCLLVDTAVSPIIVLHPHTPVTNTISVTVTQSGIVEGSVDTFIAVAPNGGGAPAFQWLLNGVAIPGATNAMYITATLAAGQIISCEVTSSLPCATPPTAISGGITVKVIPVSVQTEDIYGDKYTIKPNPNNGSFIIEGTLADISENSMKMEITDMLGRSVYNQVVRVVNGKVNQTVVLDNSLANGVYLLSVTTGSSHRVYHVVVEK